MKTLDEFIEDAKVKVSFRNLVKSIPSTTYATFALYRYPAKFIPQVVAYVLKRYARPGMTVFDPFAGYGTVGIVARLYGCNYELWDLNPMLEILHTIAILEPRDVDVGTLIKKMRASNEEFVPKWSRLHYWFHEDFLQLLYKVWGFYHSLDNEYLRFLLTIPLLKVTRYFSYDDIQRQKLSKSPKSTKRVESLLAIDWKSFFFQMLKREMENVLKRLREYQKLSPKKVNAIVKGGIDTLKTDLEEEKDILITSPPYLQSHEYIRQAKMDLFWLGFSEEYVRRLHKLEIPYRKDVVPIEVHSETYTKIKREIKVAHLRDLFERYFWNVLGALNRLQENVRLYMCLFVGHASIRGRPIPIDSIFIEHFTSMGWRHEATLIDTIVARRMFFYKINPATGIKDKRTQTESLVILRR